MNNECKNFIQKINRILETLLLKTKGYERYCVFGETPVRLLGGEKSKGGGTSGFKTSASL